jgi:hypothetical protein
MSHKRKNQQYKYRGLYVEIHIEDMKCVVIPVTVGANGIVTKGIKKKFGSRTGKTFNRFTSKEIYRPTRNITQSTKYSSVKLKHERWGSTLVQEKYRGGKACDR